MAKKRDKMETYFEQEPVMLNHSMGSLLRSRRPPLCRLRRQSHPRTSPHGQRPLAPPSGREVLRLLKRQYCINLLGIPAILMELAVLAMPTESMPSSVCLYLEWTVGFVRSNHDLGGLGIALI